MARPLRLEFAGAVYHLTSRGNARQKVFFTDDDRRLFLDTLAQVVSRYGWICHAYCLMANHYHLLVETPKANLSVGMRQLNGIYTQIDISLNSASDFVPLRPPVSLIAAGVGAKRRWSFFHNLRVASVARLFLFLGFSDRLSFQFNFVAVVQ